jgi:hypothetical protein
MEKILRIAKHHNFSFEVFQFQNQRRLEHPMAHRKKSI